MKMEYVIFSMGRVLRKRKCASFTKDSAYFNVNHIKLIFMKQYLYNIYKSYRKQRQIVYKINIKYKYLKCY